MFSQNTAILCIFYPYVMDRDWWFILGHNLRSKNIFENNIIIPSEEDNQGNGNEDWYIHVLFQNLYYGSIILL